MTITENFQELRKNIPEYITIVLAAKTRTKEEVEAAIDAGATDIGYNYVQEAELIKQELGGKAGKVKWHLIGHLQKNKINKALKIFDIIQTVDSLRKAEAINKRSEKPVSIYIEINIADETAKSGAKPEIKSLKLLIEEIKRLENLKLEGLMTMGPPLTPKELRLYFKKAKSLFDELKKEYPELKTLSMGMSDSYKTAIEEGSNMVRIGTAVFKERLKTFL